MSSNCGHLFRQLTSSNLMTSIKKIKRCYKILLQNQTWVPSCGWATATATMQVGQRTIIPKGICIKQNLLSSNSDATNLPNLLSKSMKQCSPKVLGARQAEGRFLAYMNHWCVWCLVGGAHHTNTMEVRINSWYLVYGIRDLEFGG